MINYKSVITIVLIDLNFVLKGKYVTVSVEILMKIKDFYLIIWFYFLHSNFLNNFNQILAFSDINAGTWRVLES